MDKGYDNYRVYAECEQHGCEPVIPLRGAKANQPALPLALGGRLFPGIPRHTQRFRDLYRRRAAVERLFGDLKHGYGLAPLSVRSLQRVQLHADLDARPPRVRSRQGTSRTARGVGRTSLPQ
jgi:Transposase DDE domain